MIDELASNQVIVSEVSVINVTSEAEENLKSGSGGDMCGIGGCTRDKTDDTTII